MRKWSYPCVRAFTGEATVGDTGTKVAASTASEVVPTGAGSHLFPYITLEFPRTATFCRKLLRFKDLRGDYFSVRVKCVRVIVADPRIRPGSCLARNCLSVLVSEGDGIIKIS